MNLAPRNRARMSRSRTSARRPYHVKFGHVRQDGSFKGPGQSPLFKYLTDPANGFGGEIGWNFAKFIIDKNGRIVGRFDPKVKPDAPEVVKLIEAELAK